MADSQSNAPLRADAGPPATGVTHVRTRLTAEFTVLANALAQRRGSAVTIGVAAYIASLPDGAPVSINALCGHFSEGEILISRALRELENAGYLERRRVRLPSGHIRTRTFFYDVPGRGPEPDGTPEPPGPPAPSRPRRAAPVQPSPESPPPTACAATAPAPSPPPTSTSTFTATSMSTPDQPATTPPASLAGADPRAVAVLASLRRVDARLVLSAQEAARLAPAVTQWLAAGVGATQITERLTAGLPDHFRARPASVLAFRLRETPLPAPPRPAHPVERERPAAVLPFQTCDGCERAFRAPAPGRCRDCRPAEAIRAAAG
ncbi:hypothetical protein [Streptomyces sp. bgisy022]|uniref:hypothetical protein n=1 Tax=Streptomyces sp. bgisy022 TaxID=3413769 RepID=UPI003D73D7D9